MHKIKTLCVLLGLASGGACAVPLDLESEDSELGGIQIETPATVNLVTMANNINADLQDAVVGYSASVAKNGQLQLNAQRNWGWAKRGDDGDLLWSYNRRMQVASVTKHLAAIATVKLLAANGLTIDNRIWPWLPPEWTKGSGWMGRNGVTFRHLLTHTSGVDQAYQALTPAQRLSFGNSWDGLEYAVSLDVVPSSTYAYRNANYALLRVILPRLWKAMPGSPIPNTPIDENTHTALQIALMRAFVFEPAGVTDAACFEQPGYLEAYGYDVNDPDVAGHPANTPDNCGAHAGWHLSSRDLVRVLAHEKHDDSFLAPDLRLLMNTERLGWEPESNTTDEGRQGKYWHGGDWSSGTREHHACVMAYPGGIEAALLLNSATTNGKTACTVLKDAYNNAVQ